MTRTHIISELSKVYPYVRQNLTYEGKRLIKQLRNNKNIVIKPADKNLGMTLLDKTWYHNEVMNHLKEEKTYTEVKQIPIEKIKAQIQNFITRHQNELYEQEIKSLKNDVNRNNHTSKFYIIPKIHKNPISSRPIVSSHSWITTSLSRIVDQRLQEFIFNLPTVIKDSKSLIVKLGKCRFEDKNIKLHTADVSSLYTNIPTKGGIKMVIDYLKRKNFQNWKMIEDALNIILLNNYFTFNDKWYYQKDGTAMGTPCSVVYAVIFMCNLEERFLKLCPKGILFYGRYIDDIFMITNDNHELILDNLSKMHGKIKLNIETNNNRVSFLDLNIFKGENFYSNATLDTSIFSKPVNKFLYLPFSSYHPIHCMSATIKGELIRYIRGCSNRKDYLEIRDLFFRRLMARGYSWSFIKKTAKTVSYDNREDYLKNKKKKEQKNNEDKKDEDSSPFSNNLIFKTTWTPTTSNVHIKTYLKKHSHLLKSCFKGKDPVDKTLMSYKGAKNFSQLFVRASFN